jgi:hypothetical protein
MVPMPVKMATLGIRISDDPAPADVVQDLQNIGWKEVSVVDDVPPTEFVDAVPVPLRINVSDDIPVAEAFGVEGAQLTIFESDAISGVVPGISTIVGFANVNEASVAVVAPGDRLLLACCGVGVVGGSSTIPTVEGLGLTWTRLSSMASTGSGYRLTLWIATTSKEVSGSVKFKNGDTTRLIIGSVSELSGVDLDNPIAQAVYDMTPRGMPLAIPPFESVGERGAIVSILHLNPNTGASPNPDSNFIELANLFINFILSFERLAVAFRQYNDVSGTTWSGVGGTVVGYAQIELRARGVGEVIRAVVPDTYQAFETAEAAEDVAIHVGTNPSVSDIETSFDPVIMTEAVIIAVPPQPTVADTIAKTESVSLALNPLLAVVADAGAASEFVQIDRNPLLINVSDTDAATEAVQVALGTPPVVGVAVVVFDDEVASDAVVLSLTFVIGVFDDDAADESVAFEFRSPILIDVFDDNTFPPLEPPPMPATGIARDYIDVEEGFEMGLALPVLAVDAAPGDDAVVVDMVLPVRASDVIPVVDVIDADAVTINPVLVGFDGVVIDALTPLDVVILVGTAIVLAVDALTPTDVAQASLPLKVVAADDVPPVDAAEIRSFLQAGVSDDVPHDESVAALVSVLLAEVFDEIEEGDAVLAGIPMALAVVDVPEGGESAVAERRHVSTGLYEDLHLINDAALVSAAGTATLKVGTQTDASLGLSSKVVDPGLLTSGAGEEGIEG